MASALPPQLALYATASVVAFVAVCVRAATQLRAPALQEHGMSDLTPLAASDDAASVATSLAIEVFGDTFSACVFANACLALLIVIVYATVHSVFGGLSGGDRLALKDRLVPMLLFKLLIVVLVVDPAHEMEYVLWAAWLSVTSACVAAITLSRRRLDALPPARPLTGVATLPDGTRVATRRIIILSICILALCILATAVGWTAGAVMSLHTRLMLTADTASLSIAATHAVLRHSVRSAPDAPLMGVARALDCDAHVAVDAIMDGATLTVALLHYVHVWYLNGITFGVVDLVLVVMFRYAATALYAVTRRMRAHMLIAERIDAQFPEATASQRAGEEDAVWKECTICLEPLETGRLLPVCGHVFHRTCLRRWLCDTQAHTCPLCRRGLTHDAEAKRLETLRAEAARVHAPAAAPAQAPAPPAPAAAAPAATLRFNLTDTVGFTLAYGADVVRPPPSVEATVDAHVDEAQVDTMVDMFPHLPRATLARYLRVNAHGNVHSAIEDALEGRIQPSDAERAAARAATAVAAPSAAPAPAAPRARSRGISAHEEALHAAEQQLQAARTAVDAHMRDVREKGFAAVDAFAIANARHRVCIYEARVMHARARVTAEQDVRERDEGPRSSAREAAVLLHTPSAAAAGSAGSSASAPATVAVESTQAAASPASETVPPADDAPVSNAARVADAWRRWRHDADGTNTT